MTTVLLINQPLNNRGDESAHKALIRKLCEYNQDIKVLVPFSANKNVEMESYKVRQNNVEYIPIPCYKGFNFIRDIILRWNVFFLSDLHPGIRQYHKLMMESDWIINAPGGICLGGFQNWGHLFFLLLAKYSNKKIIYYGRSIGPFPTKTKQNRRFKRYALQMLHYFSFTSIRDSKSEDLAKQLSIPYESTVDTAFLDYPKYYIPQEITRLFQCDKYIIFVPNLLIWHYGYRDRVSKTTVIQFFSEITRRIQEHYPYSKIVMLPQTHNYGTYEGDDIHFFYDISRMVNSSKIVVLPDTLNSDIQQSIIRNSSFVVGARYHSIVFAINNNVPFVALSYEHKISGMLKTLGCEDRMIDITNAFENKESTLSVLKLFDLKIDTLTVDKDLVIRAKRASISCFEKMNRLLMDK